MACYCADCKNLDLNKTKDGKVSGKLYDEGMEQIKDFINEKIDSINRTKFNVMKRVRVRKTKPVNKNS